MAGNMKRVAKEYLSLSQVPIPGISVSLPSETDLLHWHATLDGPAGTPFEGGRFVLRVDLTDSYPFKPPTLSFATKIYHPNVSNDDKGGICLGLLRPENWKPSTKLAEVLRFAYHIVGQPDPDDAVEQAIALEFKDHRAEWEKKAREWTKRYAMSSGAAGDKDKAKA